MGSNVVAGAGEGTECLGRGGVRSGVKRSASYDLSGELGVCITVGVAADAEPDSPALAGVVAGVVPPVFLIRRSASSSDLSSLVHLNPRIHVNSWNPIPG